MRPLSKSFEIVDCLVGIFKGITFKEPNKGFMNIVKSIHEAFGGKYADAKATARFLGFNEYKTIRYNPSFLKDRLSLMKSSMRLSLGLMTDDECRLFVSSLSGEDLEGVQ